MKDTYHYLYVRDGNIIHHVCKATGKWKVLSVLTNHSTPFWLMRPKTIRC